MRLLSSWQARIALAFAAITGLALLALIASVRGPLARQAPPVQAQRGPGTLQESDVSRLPSGIISVRVIPNGDGPAPPAARFYGAVSLPEGVAGPATISAVAANGATCGSTTAASGARYALDITGTDAGCTAAGAPLRFRIGNSAATSTTVLAVPEVSSAVHADLSAR